MILFWGTRTFFKYVVVVDFYPHGTVSEHDRSELVGCAHLVIVISGGIGAGIDMTMIRLYRATCQSSVMMLLSFSYELAVSN